MTPWLIHRTKPRTCPACSLRSDEAHGDAKFAPPKAGDYDLCTGCGQINVYLEGHQLRAATALELETALSHVDLAMARELILMEIASKN